MDNKNELVFQMVNNDYIQPYFKEEVELSDYSKISISDITTLGTAFVPFAQFMSSSGAASTKLIEELGTNVLYSATDKAGNAIKLTTKVHGEHNRYIGAIIKNKTTAQARFKEIPVDKIAKGEVSIDPATAIMAAELIYIANEIKVVKEQQEDMFQYLLAEKRAELEGSISFLIKVMNDYKDNFQNEIYKTSMHIKVLDIKQQAEQSISASKKHINDFLKKKKDAFNQLGNHIQNYQMALYLYAFSSFTEVIVLENYNSDYMKKISDRIEELSLDYRSTYTDCYNYLEERAEKTPQAVLFEIGSAVSKTIGEGIAKTPIGKKTLIDERIIEGSDRLSDAKESGISKLLNEFVHYKDTRVKSFIQMFEFLDKIFNNHEVLFDSENLYIPKIG